MKAATNLLILFLLGRVTKSKLQSGSYVRQAYGVGQELKEKNNYPGSGTLYLLDKNYKDILSSTESLGGERPTKLNAASLTGIWAENNTRVSLFVVLKRKECFGTSGNRIKVHLFAGWDYKENLIRQTDWVDKSNSTGVPMEGNLTPFENQKKTKFIVQAIKDPHAGNLDCIQIIKDSTKNGKRTEQEFNTVWSGNRKKSSIGKIPSVENTVDIKTATYDNSIGSSNLIGYWEDVNFDPEEYVTYYERVIEIPAPRWSTYLATKYNMEVSKTVSATIQERA